MSLSRRQSLGLGLGGLLAAPAVLRPSVARADAKVLKISHQFPASSGDTGSEEARRSSSACS